MDRPRTGYRPGHRPSLRGIVLVLLFLIPAFTAGCSLGLDFDDIEPCPADTFQEGEECLCIDGRGPIERDGTCTCPLGTSWTGSECTCPDGTTWDGEDCLCDDGRGPLTDAGTCTCPEGALWNGEVCECADGREYIPLAEGFEDVTVCGACPTVLSGDGGPFEVPGEEIWCSGELVRVASIGDPAREFVDASIYEVEEDVFLVSVAEVDTVSVTISTYAIQKNEDGVFEAEQAAPRVNQPFPQSYLESGRGTIAIEILRVDAELFVVGMFDFGEFFGFRVEDGEQLEVPPRQFIWSDLPDDTWFSGQTMTAARQSNGNDLLLIAGAEYLVQQEEILFDFKMAFVSWSFEGNTLNVEGRLGPRVAMEPAGTEPIEVFYLGFDPVRNTENLFILSGLQASLPPVAGCEECVDYQDIEPLMAEVTLIPQTEQASVRLADIDPVAFLNERANVASELSTPTEDWFQEDIGYAVLAATASGQGLVAAAVPVVATCDVDGRITPCPDADPGAPFVEGIYTAGAGAVHIGGYTRNNQVFELSMDVFLPEAVFDLGEIETNLAKEDEGLSFFVAEVLMQESSSFSALAVSNDGEDFVFEYPIEAGTALDRLRTSGPIALQDTAEGIEVFLLRSRIQP